MQAWFVEVKLLNKHMKKELLTGLGYLGAGVTILVLSHAIAYSKGKNSTLKESIRQLEGCLTRTAEATQQAVDCMGANQTLLAAGEQCLAKVEEKEMENTVNKAEQARLLRDLDTCEKESAKLVGLVERSLDLTKDSNELVKDSNERSKFLADEYYPCSFEKKAEIRKAIQWVRGNENNIAGLFKSSCVDMGYCTPDALDDHVAVFRALIPTLDQTDYFCPSQGKQAPMEDGSEGELLGRALVNTQANTPGQIALFPKTFERGFCSLASTSVHEHAHIVSGTTHAPKEERDWIYALGAATAAVCEQ